MNENKDLTCFTIGHSNRSIESFIELLKIHNIDCLIDVRSVPYSKFHPQFNKELLTESLKKESILYLYMGDLLGARHSEPNLLYPDGKVDFRKVRETQKFKSGIDRVIQGINKKYNIVLMCAEKNPMDCHRFVLISYELEKKGVSVNHIIDANSIVTNNDEEKLLIEKYYKNVQQTTMFEPSLNKQEMIEDVYERRNKEIL